MTIRSAFKVLAAVGLAAASCSSSAPGAQGDPMALRAKAQAEVVAAAPARIEGAAPIVELGAGVDGVVDWVGVTEGQPVRAGQILVRLRRADLTHDVAEAAAAVDLAVARRDRLMKGGRVEARLRALEEASRLEAVAADLNARRDRLAALVRDEIVPVADYESAAREADAAAAAARGARHAVTLAAEAPFPEEVREAEAAIVSAQARARSSAARLQLSMVVAPSVGRVLRIHTHPGESFIALSGKPILTMVDDSRALIRAEVDERDVNRVQLGQQAVVLLDTSADDVPKRLAARVIWVSPVMGRKSVQSGDPSEKSDRDILEVLLEPASAAGLVISQRVSIQFLRKQ